MLTLKRMTWTALLAMVPVFEVKGAIPFGQAVGLTPVKAYIAAIIGSTIMLTFLAYFTRWFYAACRRKGYLKRFTGWMDKIANKSLPRLKKFGPWAIVAYVAVPIPGTGTWTGAIIAITGAIDLVADADRCYVIRNGRPEMGRITGTGCQLSGMMTAFLVANPDTPLDAAAAAVCTMGLAGEIGWSRMQEGDGNSTYRNRIIDAIYNMDGAALDAGAKYEIR